MPVVNNNQFTGMTLGELKRYAIKFYKDHFLGKSVINKQKGITVQFTKKGINHVIYARKVGYVKLKAITVLDELVENGIYTQYNDRDADDADFIIGYLNFKTFAIIENKKQMLKIVVQVTKAGKYFYDEVVFINNKKSQNP